MTYFNDDPRYNRPRHPSYDPDAPGALSRNKTVDELLDMRNELKRSKLAYAHIDKALQLKTSYST